MALKREGFSFKRYRLSLKTQHSQELVVQQAAIDPPRQAGRANAIRLHCLDNAGFADIWRFNVAGHHDNFSQIESSKRC